MKEPQPKAENLSAAGAKDKTDGGFAAPLKVWQGACIAAGVFLALFGVATLIFFVAMGGGAGEEDDALRGAAVMFVFFSVAVFLFVFAGVSYGVTDRVTAEQKPRARLLAAGMGISISAILLSVTAVFILPSALGTAIMLTLMAVAVAFVVLCGIGISRFHLPETETNSGARAESGDKWSGAIMLTATAVFLLCGFLWNKWHPAWVVFPIGGLLCAIVSEIRNAVQRNDDEGKEERDEEDE